jgi:hypothetical protein
LQIDTPGKVLGNQRTTTIRAIEPRVAAVVGAASKGKRVSSIHDYATSSDRQASAKDTNGRVSGYDYSTSTHFSGGGSNNLNFYDYETSSHVQLKLNSNTFSGYDYHRGKHFSGRVSGGSISLYDYETGQYHSYSA